jgi:FkbH-like protein
MTNRGIVIGIVSKNTEAVAMEVFEKHPEMVLTRDEFAGWRINWEDKARNIAELADELNLGLQSVVFIDDNAFERARVHEALPEVFVPEWPEDPLLYARALQAMDCFDSATFTNEDRQRASMYAAEKKRASSRKDVNSLDQWLQTLEMTVQVEPVDESNLARIVQLLNKTNQMNLRTRRLTDTELVDWLQGERRCLRAVRVSDRFGDAGLTGIFSIETRNKAAHFTDFVLSCRVMGRQVEQTMVAVAAEEALHLGAQSLIAEYVPTPKNKPCLDFWKKSGFGADGSSSTFTWELDDLYPVPTHIRLVKNGL